MKRIEGEALPPGLQAIVDSVFESSRPVMLHEEHCVVWAKLQSLDESQESFVPNAPQADIS